MPIRESLRLVTDVNNCLEKLYLAHLSKCAATDLSECAAATAARDKQAMRAAATAARDNLAMLAKKRKV